MNPRLKQFKIRLNLAKRFTTGFQPKTTLEKEEAEDFTENLELVQNRWMQYFKPLLNTIVQSTQLEVVKAKSVSVSQPTFKEKKIQK